MWFYSKVKNDMMKKEECIKMLLIFELTLIKFIFSLLLVIFLK